MIRFISKRDGTAIYVETVREWFIEAAANTEVGFDIEVLWRRALNGDEALWELIEDVCGVEIVKDDTGF
jgi:hypothetical protein